MLESTGKEGKGIGLGSCGEVESPSQEQILIVGLWMGMSRGAFSGGVKRTLLFFLKSH